MTNSSAFFLRPDKWHSPAFVLLPPAYRGDIAQYNQLVLFAKCSTGTAYVDNWLPIYIIVRACLCLYRNTIIHPLWSLDFHSRGLWKCQCSSRRICGSVGQSCQVNYWKHVDESTPATWFISLIYFPTMPLLSVGEDPHPSVLYLRLAAERRRADLFQFGSAEPTLYGG